MKVRWVEESDLLERRVVFYCHGATIRTDLPALAQMLDATVGMDRAQSDSVGNIGLGDRQNEGLAVAVSGLFEAHAELEQQMGHPRHCIAAAKTYRPFAENRRFHQSVEPECTPPFRIFRRQVENIVTGDRHNRGFRVCSSAAIGDGQQASVKIDHVSGKMKGIDLPRTVPQCFIATGNALYYQAGPRGSAPFLEDIVIDILSLVFDTQLQKSGTGSLGQRAATLNFREIRVQQSFIDGHDISRSGERVPIPQPSVRKY